MGFPAVLSETIREALPEWYESALLDAGVTPIGDPDIDMVSTPRRRVSRSPSSSRSACGRSPNSASTRPRGRQRGEEVDEEIVGTEVERIREGFARLEPVERAAKEDDSVLIDFEASSTVSLSRAARRTTTCWRSLGLADRQLRGPTDRRETGRRGRGRVTFPDEYQEEKLAGEDAVFKVKVKEVREKILPELDDDFASDASEFDTLESCAPTSARKSARR